MAGRIYAENFARIQPNAPPPLGRYQNAVRSITLPLDSALDNELVKIQGNLLYAVEASSKTVKITVRYNEQRGEGIPFKEGTLIGGVEFNQIYVTADAVSGGSITLLYLIEDGNFRALNPADQFNNIEVVKSTTLETAGDVTLTNGAEKLIAAANSARRDIVIQADPANTTEIRIGETGDVGAAQGLGLSKGQSVSLSTTSAIYGYAGAAGEKVRVLWTED